MGRQWESSQSQLCSVLLQVTQSRGKQCCNIFLSFNSQQQTQSLFCAIRIGKWKCGKLGRRVLLTGDILYFRRYPRKINDFGDRVLSPDSLRSRRVKAPSTIAFRGLPITSNAYTGNDNGNNGHGLLKDRFVNHSKFSVQVRASFFFANDD